MPVGNLDGKKIGVLALGRRNSDVFANTVSRYAKADTVSLEMKGLTVEKLKEARERLAGCNLVITAFNDTDQRPNRNFGIVDSGGELMDAASCRHGVQPRYRPERDGGFLGGGS